VRQRETWRHRDDINSARILWLKYCGVSVNVSGMAALNKPKAANNAGVKKWLLISLSRSFGDVVK
jgi:hypothetical protein